MNKQSQWLFEAPSNSEQVFYDVSSREWESIPKFKPPPPLTSKLQSSKYKPSSSQIHNFRCGDTLEESIEDQRYFYLEAYCLSAAGWERIRTMGPTLMERRVVGPGVMNMCNWTANDCVNQKGGRIYVRCLEWDGKKWIACANATFWLLPNLPSYCSRF